MPEGPSGVDQVASEGGGSPILAAKDELGHLLHGIEETSKQARSILFALTTTSAFVVVAAFSDSPSGSIKLPIVGNEIHPDQFFFWSPLVVLAVYLYLQVYIQELVGRFDRLYQFQEKVSVAVSSPRDLLFPWFFVIALESRRQKQEKIRADQLARSAPIIDPSVQYIYPLAVSLIWLLGPAVLAALLFAFLREERAVAIVPCIAFLLSGGVAVGFVQSNRSRIASLAWVVAGVSVFLLTLASVPELRERTYLAALWGLRHDIARLVREKILPMVAYAMAFALPLVSTVFMGRLLYTRLAPVRLYRSRIAQALDKEYDIGSARLLRLREIFVPFRGHLRSQPGVEVEVTDLIEHARTALILGPPGSGKTTLLKYLGIRIATETRSPLLPVFLRLSRLVESHDALSDLAIATLGEYGFPNPGSYYYKACKEGRIVFLLDGLDEVSPAHRARIVDLVHALVARFPICRVYITSRPAGYQGELDDIVQDVLTLLPLSTADIDDFLRRRNGGEPEADQLIRAMKDVRLDILRNPLLLVLATQIFKVLGVTPASERKMFEEMVRFQLGMWDSVRGIPSTFALHLKLAFLVRIAQVMESSGVQHISWVEASELARTVTVEFGLGQRGDELLSETLRSDVIMEEEPGLIMFPHRSIQDYLREAAGETGSAPFQQQDVAARRQQQQDVPASS
jgi:energy-coupling factor transporter ATP-binding protein EcfA2